MQVVDLRCETKKDGRVLLADVGFTVDVDAPLALLGASGAGKSLALRCVLGLAPPELRVTGRLCVEKEVVDLADARAVARQRGRAITLLPQAAAASLDPVRTVDRQLSEVLRIHGNEEDTSARLLERVGLEPAMLRRYPLQLSGGQAQRVALALALACRPRVLLADEPTASLDNVAQDAVLTVIAGMCAARRIGLVLVTHDVAVAARVCRTAVVIAEGSVVEAGELRGLMAAPGHVATRTLVAAARRVDAMWGSHG